MKSDSHRKFAWLLPLLAFVAAVALVRADDPPAPPAEPTAPAVQAAPQQSNASAIEAAEAAREQAEKALAQAEAAAEKARLAAEKAREDARVAIERAQEEARLAAEKATEEAKAAAEEANKEVRAAVEEVQKQVTEIKRSKRTRTSNEGDVVMVSADNFIPAGTVVEGDAVAVMGDLTVEGEVKKNAVAVMGNTKINGHVHGDVVAVVGNLILGPKAVVDGNLVCIVGRIDRDPAAIVRGYSEAHGVGVAVAPESLVSWWEHALRVGRPIAVGAHLGWLWIVTAFSIAFYALLALLFPKKIAATGDKLIEAPFYVVLAAMLSVLALPVLFVLLCITIIGIPVALLVLPVGVLLAAMFGKAAIYALVGRRLTGDRLHPALAVVFGALLFTLLYLVPWFGGILVLLVWFFGFGCAVVAMFSSSNSDQTAVTPSTMPRGDVPVPAVASAGFTASAAESRPTQSAGFGTAQSTAYGEVPPVSGAAATTPFAAPVPPASPILSALTLPRAGFWIRLAAALLDFLLIVIPLGIVGAMNGGPGVMFLSIAAYSAVMWKLKGTTIGGTICGLKVVRVDDREIDWGIAIVRALGGFLSFFALGLGFIWVAFDREKQSWHDKIAGTTIVKVPKGTPLI